MKEQAAKGALWTLVELSGSQLLGLVTFMVLARLLTPEDFGVVALAGMLIAIPQVLINQGFMEAIVQRQMLDDDHVSTAFWVNLGFAALFTVATWAAAPLLARAFGYPVLEPVLYWLSFSFIFTGLVSIPGALFRRNLNFYTFAVRAVLAAIVGGVVGITMALTGYGIWALVGNVLANGFVSVFIIWLGVEWRPKWRISRAAFNDLYHYTSRTMAANFVQYGVSKADILIVGALLDAKSLGYYYLVQKLLTVIEMLAVSPISAICVPVLARMQDKPKQYGQAYAFMVWMTGLVFVPLLAGLAAIAGVLPLVFGEQWRGAVPLMHVLGLLALALPLTRHTGQIMFAIGRPIVTFRLACVHGALLAACLLPAAQFGGLIGVGYAFVAVGAGLVVVHLTALRRYTEVPIGDMLSRYSIIAMAGIAMAATVMLIGSLMQTHVVWELVAQILAGAAIYIGIILLLARPEMSEVIGTGRNLIASKRPA